MDHTEISRLAEAAQIIRTWCAENRRPLPWRLDPTPYHVWVSEIMLQQTRIETVIPYYYRFIAALPTVEALAVAPEEQLLKLWEGLGYYSRVRNMGKAARVLAAEYGGELPRSAEVLRKLPGIGEYTAGAIASIAYGEPEPAVDGNVLRVLARLFASPEDVMLPAVRKKAAESLRRVYPTGRDAALLTEGLMELGELICTPGGAPACARCPVSALCRAHERGIEAELPVRSGAKARRIEEKTVLIIACGDRRAIAKRGEKVLLANMWELPNLPGHLSLEEVADRLEKAGAAPLSVEPCGAAKHVFSHVEWHMTGYRVAVASPIAGLTFETPEVIRAQYAVPAAFRFYLDRL